MSQQDQFERIIAALHEAALDDRRWPHASALIDEVLRTPLGSHLLVLSGHTRADIEVLFERFYAHETPVDTTSYLRDYFPRDERVPRFLRLPAGCLTPCPALFTASELRTSSAYNELLRGYGSANGVLVRLAGPEDSHIAWVSTDPLDSEEWSAARLAFLTALLPHLRHFVQVRQALARAEVLHTPLTRLLDTASFGGLLLDRRGRIHEANAPALRLLRQGDGIRDEDGFLRAQYPADTAPLQRLLVQALPRWDRVAVGGSLTLRRAAGRLPLTVHITPLAHRADFGANRVAVLVLLLDPGQRPHVDPATVATTLRLTPAESRIAAAVAQGQAVKDIANRTYRSQATVRFHLKQIHAKLGLSRQADLVQLVLATAGLPCPDA